MFVHLLRGLLLVGFVSSTFAATPNWDPLPWRPKVSRCVPEELNGPDKADDGRGNSPATRALRLDFGTYRGEHIAIPMGVVPLDLVAGVDLCTVTGPGAPVCVPLLNGEVCAYAEEDKPGLCPNTNVRSIAGALEPLAAGSEGHGLNSGPMSVTFGPATDWMNSPPDVAFLMVRMQPNSGFPDDDYETALRFGGFCPVPTVMATKMDAVTGAAFPPRGAGQPSGSGFALIAADADGPNPLATFGFSQADLCLRGSQAGFERWQGVAANDSDSDGVPDGDEGFADTDEDGILDLYDGDDDGDGIPTIEELRTLLGRPRVPVDPHRKGVPIHRDRDVNENGYDDGDDDEPDYSTLDLNGTGVQDGAEGVGVVDADGDGVIDILEVVVYGSDLYDADSDDDGVRDGDEVPPAIGASDDTDGDGTRDVLDDDDDNDGVETAEELVGLGSRRPGGGFAPRDTDGDGLPDYRDPVAMAPTPVSPVDGKGQHLFSSCVSRRSAKYALELVQIAKTWQDRAMMSTVPSSLQDEVLAHANGFESCPDANSNPGPCPVHVRFYPRTGVMNGYIGGLRANLARINNPDLVDSSTSLFSWSTSEAARQLFGAIDHEFLHTMQGAWHRLETFSALSFQNRPREWQESTANWASFACVQAGEFASAVGRVDEAMSPGDVNAQLPLGSAEVVASLWEWNEAEGLEHDVPESATTGMRCVSASKMRNHVADPNGPLRVKSVDAPPMGLFQRVAHSPSLGPFTNSLYAGGPFWRYVVEQWARSAADDTHLGLPDFPARPSRQIHTPLGDLGRASDEGVDLLGYMLKEFTDRPPVSRAEPILDRIDDVFRARIGRSLAHLFADYHTALVLKEYVDVAAAPTGATARLFLYPRWRFDWTGDHNASDVVETKVTAGGPEPMGDFAVAAGLHDRGWVLSGLRAARRAARPMAVGNNLMGPDANGTERPRRMLDTWTPSFIGGSPSRRFLGPNEVVGDGSPTHLEEGGFAVLSVRPTPPTGEERSRVQIRIVSHSPISPIVRIFRIIDGVPHALGSCLDRVEQGQAGMVPEGCQPDRSGVVSETLVYPHVPGTPAPTDVENIVIVSAAQGSGAFSWAIGPAEGGAQPVIVEPTTGRPADIGFHGVGGWDDRRSFLTHVRLVSPAGDAPGNLARHLTLCVGDNLADPDVDGVRLEVPGAIGFARPEFPWGEYWNFLELPEAVYAEATAATPVVLKDLRALWYECDDPTLGPPPNPAPSMCRVQDYRPACHVKEATSLQSIKVRHSSAPPKPVMAMIALDGVQHGDETRFEDIKSIMGPILSMFGDDDWVGLSVFGGNSEVLSTPTIAGPGFAPNQPDGRDFLMGLLNARDPLNEGTSIGDALVDAQNALLTFWPAGGSEGGACDASQACLLPIFDHRMLVVAAHDSHLPLPPSAYLSPS